VGERASYDGLADWYDEFVHHRVVEFTAEVAQLLERLLGQGNGRLLDLGCGSGAFVPAVSRLGWSVVGIDASEDQLRVARQRVGEMAEDTVLTSTDIEPWEGLVTEASRVLRTGGAFVHIGVHPCFVGPHSVLREEDGALVLGPGYRIRERQFGLSAFQKGGVRARVGAAHVPLDDLVNAVISAGLALEHVEEAGTRDLPPLFGLRARRV